MVTIVSSPIPTRATKAAEGRTEQKLPACLRDANGVLAPQSASHYQNAQIA